MEKLTDWFPEHVRPVRNGVYEVKTHGFCMYAYWNGKKFGWRSATPREAAILRDQKTYARDSAVWRGVAK